jgi:V8-like Glu-specific endopeptidase
MTAAHCIHSAIACNSHSWVFDYANTEKEKSSFSFNKDQVYHCTDIIERVYDTNTLADYALIRLDRPVVGRDPLKFRRAGRPADDALMTVIGNPLGLPTKITVGADMRDNTHPVYFVTNSDTFNLNSGSAVIDSRTGIVEGILVRGGKDFTTGINECQSSIVYGQNEGRGEDVVRITMVKSLQR